MKILLLGKGGMLGQAIYDLVSLSNQVIVSTGKLNRLDLTALDRQDLDITKKNQVIKKLGELKPDIVINATGYTDVDGAQTNRKLAFAVNADGVGYLAKVCSQINAPLIHFSTDYIFDGSQPSGYCEDNTKNLKPVNVYGLSKLAGERQVLSSKFQVPNFIIRTSWLYGAGGKNFVDTILQRAIDGQKIFKIVNDQFGKPTWTGDLAKRVVWIIERIDKLDAGIYHCVNEMSNIKCQMSNLKFKSQNLTERRKIEGITWYQFAKEIFKQAKNLGILSKIPKVMPCDSKEFPRPARRPKYSALINSKLPEMREWRQALRDYLISNVNNK